MLKKITSTKSNLELIVIGLAILVIGVMSFINLFYGIGVNKIYDWDESSAGIVSWQMLQDSEFLVNRWYGEDDFWRAYPPLHHWVLMTSYAIFGPTLFALRFPSALFGLGTLIVVFIYTYRISKKLWAAILAVFILLTNYWYITQHSVRHGDIDSSLVFLVLLACLLLDSAIRNHKRPMLYAFGLVLSLIFLLKSFAVALAALPFLFLLASKKGLLKLFGLKQCLITIGISLVPVLAWVAWRYSYDGLKFLTHMVSIDLVQRGDEELPQFSHNPLTYWDIWTKHVYPWGALTLSLPFIVTYFFIIKKSINWKLTTLLVKNHQVLLIFFSVAVLVPVFLVTNKLFWYLNSSYPFFAIIIAIVTVDLISNLGATWRVLLIFFLSLGIFKSETAIMRFIKQDDPVGWGLMAQTVLPDLQRLSKDEIYIVGPLYGDKMNHSELLARDVLLTDYNIEYKTPNFQPSSSNKNHVVILYADWRHLERYLAIVDYEIIQDHRNHNLLAIESKGLKKGTTLSIQELYEVFYLGKVLPYVHMQGNEVWQQEIFEYITGLREIEGEKVDSFLTPAKKAWQELLKSYLNAGGKLTDAEDHRNQNQ